MVGDVLVAAGRIGPRFLPPSLKRRKVLARDFFFVLFGWVGTVSLVDGLINMNFPPSWTEEKNPLARTIMSSLGMPVLIAVKSIGTAVALALLLWLYHRACVWVAWPVMVAISIFQGWVLWILLF